MTGCAPVATQSVRSRCSATTGHQRRPRGRDQSLADPSAPAHGGERPRVGPDDGVHGRPGDRRRRDRAFVAGGARVDPPFSRTFIWRTTSAALTVYDVRSRPRMSRTPVSVEGHPAPYQTTTVGVGVPVHVPAVIVTAAPAVEKMSVVFCSAREPRCSPARPEATAAVPQSFDARARGVDPSPRRTSSCPHQTPTVYVDPAGCDRATTRRAPLHRHRRRRRARPRPRRVRQHLPHRRRRVVHHGSHGVHRPDRRHRRRRRRVLRRRARGVRRRLPHEDRLAHIRRLHRVRRPGRLRRAQLVVHHCTSPTAPARPSTSSPCTTAPAPPSASCRSPREPRCSPARP